MKAVQFATEHDFTAVEEGAFYMDLSEAKSIQDVYQTIFDSLNLPIAKINVDGRLVVWEENSPKGNKKRPAIVCFESKKGTKVFEREGYDGVSTILNKQEHLCLSIISTRGMRCQI